MRLDRLGASLPPENNVIRLQIPPGSSLFLTASEFRALKDVSDRQRVSVVVETEDPLRRQLATMFGLRALEVGAPPRPRPLPDPLDSSPDVLPRVAAPEPVSITSRSNGRASLAPGDSAGAASSETRGDSPDPEAPTNRGRPGEARQVAGFETGFAPDSAYQDDSPDPDAREWDQPRSQRLRPSRRAVVIVIAALAMAVLIALGALAVAAFVFARADVVIDLKQQPVTAQTTLHVVADDVGADIANGAVVRGRYVTIDVAIDQTAPTTGSGKIGQSPATGSIELANLTDAEVEIEAGTVGTGDTGVEFQITNTVTVPAASDQGPGQANAQVQVILPGTQGNLGGGELSGRLENGVFFSNRLTALAGGTDTDGRIVSEADQQSLRDAAHSAVSDEAGRQFAATLESGTTAIPATFEIGKPKVTFDHYPGDAAESLTIHAVYTVTALTYRADDANEQLREQLLPALGASAPQGFEIDQTSLRLADPEPIADADPDSAGADFTVTASARAVARFTPEDEAALAEQLSGSSETDAEALLSDNPAIDDFSIDYSPPWPVLSMPDDADRIDISVED